MAIGGDRGEASLAEHVGAFAERTHGVAASEKFIAAQRRSGADSAGGQTGQRRRDKLEREGQCTPKTLNQIERNSGLAGREESQRRAPRTSSK